MAGVTRNADATLKRSSRIGFGAGTTAPFGIPTVTVMPSWGASAKPGKTSAAANVAVSPVAVAEPHAWNDPYGPCEQFTPVISAGACTVTFAAAIGTGHSTPIAFHTSSSWSSNPLSAPRTR